MHRHNCDGQTINKLIKGDVCAFEEIYRKYNKKIYVFAFRYLKSREDAEGVVQEVFLELWKNCKKLRRDTQLNAWLFTVTFNNIRKRFRSSVREKKHLTQYETRLTKHKDELPEIEFNDLLNNANHILEKLPPQQKKIFLLRREEGQTSSEIASQLSLSKKTVENHLNRAHVFLREALEKELDVSRNLANKKIGS